MLANQVDEQMTQDEIAGRVTEAHEHLSAAIEGLARMEAPASEYSASLQKTADLLADVERAQARLDQRRFAEPLAALAKQVNTAQALLGTAAALHFGNFLNGRAIKGGYERDGALSSFGGNGFRIDG